jgi:lipocalin
MLLLVAAYGCRIAPKVDNQPVAALDLKRYLGEWYEIARLEHAFERGMEKCRAMYSLRKDGQIDVVNSGVKNGTVKQAYAVAKTTETPGLLRVSFFWPFYADYRILWLDDDYQYVLVGGSSADYLWILSRTSTIDVSVKNAILAEARQRGYDTDKLIWVEQ